MVDAVYRGNIEELLSVINHLKKYIIAFVIVVLVLVSVIHFSKYSVHIVPLVTVTFVLLPAVYYTTVLVLKFGTSFVPSNRIGEATTMNTNGNQQGLKTPDVPYPKSPTPPPSYEEATRNDHYHCQPNSWLPSTSSGYVDGTLSNAPPPVFNVEYQYNATVSDGRPATTAVTTRNQQLTCDKDDRTPQPSTTRTTSIVQNIPSVTITMDNEQRSMEI